MGKNHDFIRRDCLVGTALPDSPPHRRERIHPFRHRNIHNNLTGLTQTVNGVERCSSYTYDDDNRVTSVTAAGTTTYTYTYDAWGDPLTTTGSLASTLGTINPLRYRGYVYDTETGLYYLQTRYYNPKICRFLNADELISSGQGLLSNNMFTYCLNNPVVYSDPSGRFALCMNAFDLVRSWAEDLMEHVENTVAEVNEEREKHINRNAEQDAYLEALQLSLGSEAKLIEHIEDNWEKQGAFKNLYHINIFSNRFLNALTNIKYLSSDGKYEVVICYPWFSDPYIVTSSVNRGTSNNGTDNVSDHFTMDMLPYYLLGNDGDGLIGDFLHDLFPGG